MSHCKLDWHPRPKSAKIDQRVALAMDFVIRPLTPEDEPILWEMLYHGLRTSEGASLSQQEIPQHPELARYVENWGRSGDTGFVAHDENKQLLGAAWFRFHAKPRDEEAIPELALAVKSGLRRRGIGAALLTQLVKANPEKSVIVINATPKNPAVRLYERFGFRITDEAEGSVIMRREA